MTNYGQSIKLVLTLRFPNVIQSGKMIVDNLFAPKNTGLQMLFDLDDFFKLLNFILKNKKESGFTPY